MHWDGLQTPAWNGAISNEAAKREIADQLASRASNGQVIGIGSGSTSFLALLALSDRVKKEGLNIPVRPNLTGNRVLLHSTGVDDHNSGECSSGLVLRRGRRGRS